MNKIQVSIHPSVWIPRWTNDAMPTALERASRLGFDRVVVPLRRFQDIDPPAIAKGFESFGIRPLNSCGQTVEENISSDDTQVRQRGRERLRKAVRLARDMGSDHVGGVLYSPIQQFDDVASRENIRHAAEALCSVGEEARSMGVRLALEVVNRYETNMLNTADQGLAFLDLVQCDNVYLHLDTFHMNIEERDMITPLRRAMKRLVYFELDQNNRGSLETGSIDFKPLLAELSQSGYTGIVGIEAFSRSLLAPDLANALSIWRDVFTDGDEVAAQGIRSIRGAFAD